MTRMLRWRWHTTGLEHVPTHGPAIITWNHHSPLDFLTVACDIYLELGRPVRVLVAERFVEHRLLGWLLRLVDAIPVAREDGGRALQVAETAIADGHLVLIAPEGRVSSDGSLGEFRAGAARLAEVTGAPLIPSAGWGTQAIAARGSVRPRRAWRADVGVAFGPAVVPGSDVVETTDRLRDRTARLLAELRQALPAGADRVA